MDIRAHFDSRGSAVRVWPAGGAGGCAAGSESRERERRVGAAECEHERGDGGQAQAGLPIGEPRERGEALHRHRAGRKAFAVVNDKGKLQGYAMHSRFHSASTVKSMLLVAYLRMLGSEHRALGEEDREVLYPMIHSSDNEAATDVLSIVGEGRLNGVARAARMRDYEPAGATWGFTEVSAADLARFFYVQDRLIPRRYVGYARWLFSTIEASESWGIPAVARPEFTVFFKGGWLPEIEGLVNQVGRLEGRGITFSLAVMSTHDRSMEYGERTIEGVTARLLGRAR